MSIPAAPAHHAGTLSPEYALLGFLLDGPRHGYELHRRLVDDLGGVWHVSQSQAYSILKRLELSGDIAARRVQRRGQPPRQVLHLTAAGRRRFMSWLQGSGENSVRAIRLDFLTRMYFAERYLPDKASSIYAAQLEAADRAVRRLRALASATPASQTYNRLSIELRLRQMQLIRRWIGSIRTRLRRGARKKS